ncbi:CHAT domain-containing protein [Sandarakinorhabdus sp.]|uniref:CHAT domain-containing protein n=1 Tax=Sandarakinorhabdus sp. TaxID=1916663 RepID=UPI00286E0781|nr:CHAT domain-containing protein [Sandarakinorhabdus sp.]
MTRFARLLAGAAMALGVPALAAPALPDAFDLGRGPQGELCRAERLWNDPAATGVFDIVYSVRCRGWTDTASVGRIALFTGGMSALPAVRTGEARRITCGAAGTIDVAGLGAGEASRCRNIEGGYAAFALAVPRGKQLVTAEGLERFAGNLMAGAEALAGTAALPGASVTPRATLALASLGDPASGAGGVGDVDEGALAGRRGEVLDYSVRGQHGEARELATRYLARLPSNARQGDRIEFTLEAALSASNLGYADSAAAYLEQAALLIDAPESPRGAARDALLAKLAVYRAMNALNARDFTAAAALAKTALATDTSTATAQNPLADPIVLGRLNAGGGRSALSRKDVSWVRPTILRAQTLYVEGGALRGLGKLTEALAPLVEAERLLMRFDNSGLDASSLLWLRSALAAEQGRIAQRQGLGAVARGHFERAAAVIADASVYAGTPLHAQRQIDLANAAVQMGDNAAARTAFDAGFDVLRTLGPSTAASVGGLEGYFDVLAAEIAAGTAGAPAAKARFFEAAQLLSPPAVAGQIAQLQKIFESGSSDGAVKAKTLQDIDRETRALGTRLSLLAANAPGRAEIEAEFASLGTRAAAIRTELAGDQQFQQATESVASLEELQKAMRPGEAYLKIVSLTGRSFAMLVRDTDSAVYRTGADTAALAQLARSVRKSIDGTINSDGRPIVLVYDVAKALQLKSALLDGAGRLLDGVTTLVTEPSGPMTQLPYGVLVEDQASVDAFAASVKLNSRDYSKVRFLASGRRIDSAVSPRSFLISRSISPSRAAQPYLGLGNHAPPTASELTALPSRGSFKGQCGARADVLRASFASLRPVGAAEINAAAAAMGKGSEELEQAAFTDTALGDAAGVGGRLGNFAVLHFATHGLKEGELDCDSPPALVTSIADVGDSDGLLSFEEIAAMKLDANLVALSACNTAASAGANRAGQSGFRNEIGQAATLNGLARAFMVAGSRAVLTTHWAIPDSFRTRDGRQIAASTRLISTMFEAGAHAPMGDALRTAQMAMIAAPDTSHPYYWGAFMLVGDGARPMLSPAASGTGQ